MIINKIKHLFKWLFVILAITKLGINLSAVAAISPD